MLGLQRLEPVSDEMELHRGLLPVGTVAQVEANPPASKGDVAGAILGQLGHEMAVEAAAGAGLAQPRRCPSASR